MFEMKEKLCLPEIAPGCRVKGGAVVWLKRKKYGFWK